MLALPAKFMKVCGQSSFISFGKASRKLSSPICETLHFIEFFLESCVGTKDIQGVDELCTSISEGC